MAPRSVFIKMMNPDNSGRLSLMLDDILYYMIDMSGMHSHEFKECYKSLRYVVSQIRRLRLQCGCREVTTE